MLPSISHLEVSIIAQALEQCLLNNLFLPAGKASIDIVSSTVFLGKQPPGTASSGDPKHVLDKTPSRGFLRHIDAYVPADLDVHIVVDNYATHKHPKARFWLAKRPWFHIHSTPTCASWLNHVERRFGLIAQRQIHRSASVSAKDLDDKINAFVQAYNAKATPFMWTPTAEAILDKAARLRSGN